MFWAPAALVIEELPPARSVEPQKNTEGLETQHKRLEKQQMVQTDTHGGSACLFLLVELHSVIPHLPCMKLGLLLAPSTMHVNVVDMDYSVAWTTALLGILGTRLPGAWCIGALAPIKHCAHLPCSQVAQLAPDHYIRTRTDLAQFESLLGVDQKGRPAAFHVAPHVHPWIWGSGKHKCMQICNYNPT